MKAKFVNELYGSYVKFGSYDGVVSDENKKAIDGASEIIAYWGSRGGLKQLHLEGEDEEGYSFSHSYGPLGGTKYMRDMLDYAKEIGKEIINKDY